MLVKKSSYDEVYSSFRWSVPEYYNIGVDVCDKWADERYRLALIYEDEEGKAEKFTFWDLKGLSNRLANALQAYGIERGDRVGILLPQCPETALAHIAIYKIGGIAIPLFTLFGPDALEYRLGNSEAKAVITDGANIEKILQIKDKLPHLKIIIATKAKPREGVQDFWKSVEKGSSHLEPVKTKADDPALIIYTSGTTGPPKGALHAHRVVLGHVPGVEFFHNFFPEEGRPLLDPGRLGLDRGPDRRPPAQLAPRRAGRGLSGQEIRPRAGLPFHREIRDPQRLHAPHGPQDDAPGQRPAEALRLPDAHHRLRRGNPGRRASRLGERGHGADHQRILRADRSQPGRGELLRDHADPAGLHGQADPRPPGGGRGRGRERRSPGNRRGGGHSPPRPGHVPGILAKSGSDERQVRQGLVVDRRSGQEGRGRVFLVRGPQGRPDHQRRATGSGRRRSKTA